MSDNEEDSKYDEAQRKYDEEELEEKKLQVEKELSLQWQEREKVLLSKIDEQKEQLDENEKRIQTTEDTLDALKEMVENLQKKMGKYLNFCWIVSVFLFCLFSLYKYIDVYVTLCFPFFF